MSSFYCVRAKSLQSCLTLCDPMDCSPPDSSVHGVLQARTLEGAAMPFPRGSSRLRLTQYLLHRLHWQVGSLPLAPPGKPEILNKWMYLMLLIDSSATRFLSLVEIWAIFYMSFFFSCGSQHSISYIAGAKRNIKNI